MAPPPRIVLHIGPHKTGTTSIQDFLSRNRDALLARGIDFPLFGRTERGAQAHRHFSAYARDIPAEHPDGFAAALHAWRPEAAGCILSSEDFWFASTPGAIDRLAAALPGIARIVVFLRDPCDHLVSHYREGIKGGLSLSFPEFVDLHARRMERPKNGFAYYRFQDNIACWQARFPVARVPYAGDMDIIAAFLQATGTAIDTEDTRPAPHRNPAAPACVSALQLTLNRALRDGLLERRAFGALKKALAGSDAAALEQRFADRLHRIAVPSRPFLHRFRHHSPDLAEQFVNSPETMDFSDISPHFVPDVLQCLRTHLRV